ncbi:hypothetical protein [Winogradskyella vincentii]|uniref:Metallo-peptidase family M12B Reprolysin-like n=1 Tax=Winogradskyella vincentii TaxID=2877122 RepID=A0ABS7Y3F6_9FLAO|nr:hypothetical protein [Winogradskyella vincentii]MCA0154458.1 hypothetical protein [Winogradskyella vincentii]
MKVFISFIVLIPLFGMSQDNINKNSIEFNKSLYTDSITVGRFHVRFTDQFDDADKMKTKNGLLWLDEVMDKDSFKSKVVKMRYKNTRIKNKVNKKCKAENRTKKRYNAEEIFELLVKGNDGLGNLNDQIIDLYLDLDPDLRGNVLGSTSCGRIKSGRLFFENNSKEKYASHLIHEYMHVLGFNHFLNKPLFRSFFLKKNDPPYQIGKLTRALIPQ